MNIKELLKLIEKSGTKVTKDRLVEELRKTTAREFEFVKDPATGVSIIKFKF